jgi:hypothetical protein
MASSFVFEAAALFATPGFSELVYPICDLVIAETYQPSINLHGREAVIDLIP